MSLLERLPPNRKRVKETGNERKKETPQSRCLYVPRIAKPRRLLLHDGKVQVAPRIEEDKEEVSGEMKAVCPRCQQLFLPTAGHRCPPSERRNLCGGEAHREAARIDKGTQRGFRHSHPGARTVLCVPASAAVKRSGTLARCQAHVGGEGGPGDGGRTEKQITASHFYSKSRDRALP